MKIDRLIAMIMILLEHEVQSAGELARKLEVSRRTIYRDIDTLTLAGLPIFTTQGSSGGVGLMRTYKMDKRLFTRTEMKTLAASLDSYRQLYGHKELVHALEKLKSMGQSDERGDETGGTFGSDSRFVVDLALNRGNQSLRMHLGSLETAINEARYLSFDYRDHKGEATSRTIEPYRVVFKESRWYVQGYCLKRQDYRVFKLARMSRLVVLAETFKPRDFKPLAMDGTDWMNRDVVPVKIRIALSVKDRVIERFGEANILAEEGDSCLALYPIVNNAAGYEVLLRFGDKCEVLEPQEVREGFARYVREILSKYEGCV